MRHTLFFSLALLLAGGVVLAGQVGADQLSHAIFVKVNGKGITQDNVIEATKYLIKREYHGKPPMEEAEMERVQKAALRDLVRTYLIHDEAAKLGLKPDRVYFRQSLPQLGLKPEEVTPTIRKMLEADDLFVELMLAEGTPLSNPNPKQLRDFYTKNREEFRTNKMLIVRTMFIPVEPGHPQSFFKEQAEGVMRGLEMIPLGSRTAAFEAKAREISQDPFAEYGGLLTGSNPERWIPSEFQNITPDGQEMLPGPMAEGIRKLAQRGELRLAISREGMHILYCEDVKGGSVMPWEEAQRIIDYVLRQRDKNARMRRWINRVYDRSDVRWHDGSLYDKKTLTEILLPSEKGAVN